MINKSSVEQFAIALYEGGYLQGNGDEINALLEHHKAMHKEEIITTWHKGYDNLSPMIDEENCGDKHYQKTFNQQQND